MLDLDVWAMKVIKFGVAAAVTLVAAVHMSPALITLFWIMLLDQLSGMVVGFRNKKLSSSRGWDGLKKKSLMWLLIGAGHLADQVINVGFDIDQALAIYYIINEFLSVIENAALAGVPFPTTVIDVLTKLRAQSNQPQPGVQIDMKATVKVDSDILQSGAVSTKVLEP